MYPFARRLIAPFLLIGVAMATLTEMRSARGDDRKPNAAALALEDGGAPAAKNESVAALPHADTPATPKRDGHAVTITTADGKTATCREQAAQPFLIRGNWFPNSKDPEVIKHGRQQLENAIQYRTTTYGHFAGFGSPKANPHPPKFYAKSTTFMGLTIQVHEKIIPALKCVEAALKANGAADEYRPHSAGGIRFRNTYRGLEVSNHVYGIAIDIEPDKNTCCGCVAPWPNHPLCKAKNKTVWERMAMPKSWVDTFERYGFYWLGHDVLQDTMHFEFLGDPNKILD
ncbi:MAG: M15 family metallopeptidase [Polyangiaceae bacterium]|nr:M15 family metallopeptidase [Polyangiaceae bacterium]